MRRLLLLTAMTAVVSSALAGPDVLPIGDVRYVSYDAATGEITPVTAETRWPAPIIWSAGYEYVGWAWAREYDLGEAGSDWGDVAGPATVGGVEFLTFTNSQASDGDVWVAILYYTDDNGYGSTDKVYTGGLHGPGIWDRALIDPNNLPPEAPGVEDAVDGYADPNWNAGFHNIDPNNINAAYYGSGTFTNAYGQIHMVLFAPGCPNRGDSGRYCEADIGEVDCIVGLADLAQLLSNYGCQSDPNGPDLCSLTMGDVDPYDDWLPGDGDVDLDDLAELLSQYGDDCNWPRP